MLESNSLRQAWTLSHQLPASAMSWLGWVPVIFFVLGILVVEVWLPRAGQWAEVPGSGLTNLLCMVGVTGVYWEGERSNKTR